jgi:hypothetical protein
MKFKAMVLGFVVAASGCNLTQPYEKATTPCESASCAQNTIRNAIIAPASRQSTGTDPSIPGHYMYWYQTQFTHARNSDFGVLDIVLSPDVFETTLKNVYTAGPWVVGSDCTGSSHFGGFTGKAQIFNLATNQLVAEGDLLRGMYFQNDAGSTYRLHYEFKDFKTSAGNCDTLTVRVPVYMDIR